MPAQRRPIINLREAIQARQLLVDTARISAIDNDTHKFLRLVAAWVDVHKRELVEYEERHMTSVQQSVQKSRALKVDIEENRATVEKLLGSIETQQQELRKIQDAVAEERERRRKQQQSLSVLTSEVEQVKRSISKLRSGHEGKQRVLEEEISRVAPELVEYQQLLNMRIDPVQPDILQVRYTNVDALNHEREFTLLLDVSQDDYRVPSSKPLLPSLPSLVETLNLDRDFFAFLKHTRMAFVEYAQDERGERT